MIGITVLNIVIMFGFVYFAVRGIKSWFHHLALMKYVYGHMRRKKKVARRVFDRSEDIFDIYPEERPMKKITGRRS